MLQSQIVLTDLEVFTRIGVTDEEREASQPVYFDVILELENLPKGSISDQIEDTICYATVAEKLRICAETPRLLIEKLAHDAYLILRNHVPSSVRIWLRVSKSYPIKNLPRASFSVGEPLSHFRR